MRMVDRPRAMALQCRVLDIMLIREAISSRAVVHGGLVVLSLMVGLVALEAAGRVVTMTITKTDKLFGPDRELGWALLADLDMTRKNADGDLWHITTDDAGVRGPSAWPEDDRPRLLILGDSFAFGEGVELADRFDTLIQERIPQLSVINLGVMGYGPDQQLIRARPWKSDLRPGDVLLLLTYGNDYYDLARTRHGGRSKPWIEDAGDRLIVHEPAIDFFDHLRDRSYLFTLLTRSVAQLGASEHTQERLESVDELYRKWVVQEVEDLVARGVRVVIAHHGDAVLELPFDVDAMFARVCPAVSGCLALDEALADHPRGEVFLADGHWAPGGHRIAAEQIGSYLETLARRSREATGRGRSIRRCSVKRTATPFRAACDRAARQARPSRASRRWSAEAIRGGRATLLNLGPRTGAGRARCALRIRW
jgi:hypothetical protein